MELKNFNLLSWTYSLFITNSIHNMSSYWDLTVRINIIVYSLLIAYFELVKIFNLQGKSNAPS